MFIYFIIAMALTFILTACAARFLIPKLKSYKMGQKILDIGPRWHKSKEGTPTMGGLSFIFASVIVMLIVGTIAIVTGAEDNPVALLLTFGMALLNGAVGFLDDYVKFFKKQNEGLKANQKYLLQLIVAGAYLFAMRAADQLTTALPIPFTDIEIELGIVYYVFALILITGVVNSSNLADGIDGFLSTITFVIGGFFALVSFTAASFSGVLLSALVIGACLGFLVYNFYPAKLFMGDTGSLFLGGMTVGMAFLINQPLIILVAGFIYVVESASVMLQVGCYKLTHKRIFKMAPIHHHFEKCGWSEWKIVGVFSFLTLIMCIIAYLGVI